MENRREDQLYRYKYSKNTLRPKTEINTNSLFISCGYTVYTRTQHWDPITRLCTWWDYKNILSHFTLCLPVSCTKILEMFPCDIKVLMKSRTNTWTQRNTETSAADFSINSVFYNYRVSALHAPHNSYRSSQKMIEVFDDHDDRLFQEQKSQNIHVATL